MLVTYWTNVQFSNMPPTCLLSSCSRPGHLRHHSRHWYRLTTCQHPHSASLVREDQVESEVDTQSLPLLEPIHGNHRLCPSIWPQFPQHVRQRLALRLATNRSLRSRCYDIPYGLPLGLCRLRGFTRSQVWRQKTLVLQHHQCHEAEERPATL